MPKSLVVSPTGAVQYQRADETLLYSLNYIRGNIQQFKLIRFSEDLPMAALIKAAKHYCDIHNLRFVFIESAVTIIEVQSNDEVVEGVA